MKLMRKLVIFVFTVFLVLSAQAYAESKWPMTIIFRPVDNPGEAIVGKLKKPPFRFVEKPDVDKFMHNFAH